MRDRIVIDPCIGSPYVYENEKDYPQGPCFVFYKNGKETMAGLTIGYFDDGRPYLRSFMCFTDSEAGDRLMKWFLSYIRYMGHDVIKADADTISADILKRFGFRAAKGNWACKAV